MNRSQSHAIVQWSDALEGQWKNFDCDIQPYHNLFAIPFREIESNTGVTLEQNLGYLAD